MVPSRFLAALGMTCITWKVGFQLCTDSEVMLPITACHSERSEESGCTRVKLDILIKELSLRVNPGDAPPVAKAA